MIITVFISTLFLCSGCTPNLLMILLIITLHITYKFDATRPHTFYNNFTTLT